MNPTDTQAKLTKPLQRRLASGRFTSAADSELDAKIFVRTTHEVKVRFLGMAAESGQQLGLVLEHLLDAYSLDFKEEGGNHGAESRPAVPKKWICFRT